MSYTNEKSPRVVHASLLVEMHRDFDCTKSYWNILRLFNVHGKKKLKKMKMKKNK